MSETVYVRPGKLRELYDRMEKLEANLAINNLHKKEMIEGGSGMHDNAGYDDAVRQERVILEQIGRLRDVLGRVEEFDPPKEGAEEVIIGAFVNLIDTETSKVSEIMIGGYEETDVDQGVFAYQSPFASAFLGKKTGDRVRFESPRGKVQHFKILSIHLPGV